MSRGVLRSCILLSRCFRDIPYSCYLSISGTGHTYQDVVFPSCYRILRVLCTCVTILTSWCLYDVNRRISVLRRFADLPSHVATEEFRARVPRVLPSYGCFWLIASCVSELSRRASSRLADLLPVLSRRGSRFYSQHHRRDSTSRLSSWIRRRDHTHCDSRHSVRGIRSRLFVSRLISRPSVVLALGNTTVSRP